MKWQKISLLEALDWAKRRDTNGRPGYTPHFCKDAEGIRFKDDSVLFFGREHWLGFPLRLNLPEELRPEDYRLIIMPHRVDGKPLILTVDRIAYENHGSVVRFYHRCQEDYLMEYGQEAYLYGPALKLHIPHGLYGRWTKMTTLSVEAHA
jgi:hypothetical protein